MIEGITPNIGFSRTSASTQVLKSGNNIDVKGKEFADASALAEKSDTKHIARNFFKIENQLGAKIDSTA